MIKQTHVMANHDNPPFDRMKVASVGLELVPFIIYYTKYPGQKWRPSCFEAVKDTELWWQYTQKLQVCASDNIEIHTYRVKIYRFI
jgi:hypothetical protein